MKKILPMFLALTMMAALGCSPTETTQSQDTTATAVVEEPETVTPPIMRTEPEAGDTIAILTTNQGVIRAMLYTDQVPETTKNFIELSKEGKYNGTIFHRIIPDFMIQGGDFENRDGSGGYSYNGPGTTLKDEVIEGLVHKKGALSMAKTQLPDTAGSQFFIVQRDGGTDWLDGVHTVFGFVYEGMDVADEMAAVETGAADKPLVDVVLEKIEIGTY